MISSAVNGRSGGTTLRTQAMTVVRLRDGATGLLIALSRARMPAMVARYSRRALLMSEASWALAWARSCWKPLMVIYYDHENRRQVQDCLCGFRGPVPQSL